MIENKKSRINLVVLFCIVLLLLSVVLLASLSYHAKVLVVERDYYKTQLAASCDLNNNMIDTINYLAAPINATHLDNIDCIQLNLKGGP